MLTSRQAACGDLTARKERRKSLLSSATGRAMCIFLYGRRLRVRLEAVATLSHLVSCLLRTRLSSTHYTHLLTILTTIYYYLHYLLLLTTDYLLLLTTTTTTTTTYYYYLLLFTLLTTTTTTYYNLL